MTTKRDHLREFKSLSPIAGVMTVSDVAAYLKLSEKTIRALARERQISATKIGDKWRFRKSDIDEWLQAQIKR